MSVMCFKMSRNNSHYVFKTPTIAFKLRKYSEFIM